MKRERNIKIVSSHVQLCRRVLIAKLIKTAHLHTCVPRRTTCVANTRGAQKNVNLF